MSRELRGQMSLLVLGILTWLVNVKQSFSSLVLPSHLELLWEQSLVEPHHP